MDVPKRCESCEHLREENQLLRQQLLAATANRNHLTTRGWIFTFVAGWILLTVMPLLSTRIGKIHPEGVMEYLILGSAIAVPVFEASILLTILVLLAEPIWQKLLLFAVASAWLGVWIAFVISDIEQDIFAPLSPLAACLVAIPALIFRIVFRWQIVHQSNANQMKPTSIATYLVVTLAIACLIAGYPLLSTEIKNFLSDGSYFIYFWGPLTACMIITVSLIAYFLRDQKLAGRRGVVVLSAWLLLSWLLSAGLLDFPLWLQPDSTESLGYLALFAASFAVTFTFWYALALVWLRALGYRLRHYSASQPVSDKTRLT